MNNRIPKIIHYCWFGNKEMGELEIMCLDSWKAVLPNYQIRLWNEEFIDLNQFPFANEAYKAGKYAFVSDVIRLHALYQEGGIYLDTDMLVLKSFDQLLYHDFFTGEYKPKHLNAAVVGAKPGNLLLAKLLKAYQNLEFDFFKPKTIPEIFDELVWSFPDQSIKIFPPDFFYSLPFEKKGDDFSSYLSNNSYAVHLWNHSWKDEFGLLRQDRFWESFCLAVFHLKSFPKIYLNIAYVVRYASFFKKHFKRYLKNKLDGKA